MDKSILIMPLNITFSGLTEKNNDVNVADHCWQLNIGKMKH